MATQKTCEEVLPKHLDEEVTHLMVKVLEVLTQLTEQQKNYLDLPR